MEFMPFKKKSLTDTVKEYLYNYIRNIDIDKDTKLPSEEFIAQNLGVSRATIRSALTDLESDGFIFRIHGKGTFINPRAVQMKVTINPGNELLQMIIDSGYNARAETLGKNIIKADYELAGKLCIEEGEEVLILEKLFYADNNPAILCRDKIPMRYIKGYKEDEFEYSTFEVIRKYSGKLITWDDIEMTSLNKSEVISETTSINKIKAESILVFNTNNYDQENNLIFTDIEYYDTKYIRFNIIRQKNIKYKEN
ncbi:MAG: GntR family transcriptional regulator [Clostridium sp.]